MIDRRAFATLLAGACAAPGLAWGQDLKGKVNTARCGKEIC